MGDRNIYELRCAEWNDETEWETHGFPLFHSATGEIGLATFPFCLHRCDRLISRSPRIQDNIPFQFSSFSLQR